MATAIPIVFGVSPGALYISGANSYSLNLDIGSPIFALDLDGDKSPDVAGTIGTGQSLTSTVTLKHLNAFDDSVALACLVQLAQGALWPIPTQANRGLSGRPGRRVTALQGIFGL
jgi:hypothetical protein